MTDSAETMRALVQWLKDAPTSVYTFTADGQATVCHPRYLLASDRDVIIALLEREIAALSASGTKSEIDEAGLERAVRECARITAPEITDAEYEAIRKAKEPRYLNTCAEMRRALIAYLGEAGEASTKPGPSDPIPSQPDEREAIAETIWRAEYRRATGRERSIPWSEASPIDQERYRYVAAAILAMQAERRGDNTIQRDKIYRAAERSNTRFGQWIPERWVNIFVEEMSK